MKVSFKHNGILYYTYHSFKSTDQFTAGVWALLAATTFWNGYRNWQSTGGHGATWPLMAFLLVLQVRKDGPVSEVII